MSDCDRGVCEPPQGSYLHDPIDPRRLGHASLTPTGRFEAGSFASFTLVYTAGVYGIDDSGSIRIVFRFATDQSALQFDDPKGVGFTTVEASNNAKLDCRYEYKGNVRPWDRCLTIRVLHGFMKEGDTITVRFGDTRQGSPGLRLQTFAEKTFEFRVLADPIATCNYQALPEQPAIEIGPGRPVRWIGVLPTLRRAGETFRLCLKAEDRWGNPSDQYDGVIRLVPSHPIAGLPETVRFRLGELARVIDGLSVGEPCDVRIKLLDAAGAELAETNPLRIAGKAELLPYWGDLHAQSEETIGTGSAEEFFAFARDLAFLDAAAHQGNDFQITAPFWRHLNELTAQWNEDGRFVVLPGYEWSGNTALGGDRNVFFSTEGRPIRRSSHALVKDRSDLESDCTTAAELFAALRRDGEDAICFAHCGGRYADVKQAHDGVLETAVEVHSSWGTFEWLLRDAFEMGYRVGIVANSDGHKGRPGAEWPGASMFGAYGGLTCFLMPELSRAALFECLRRRRHYATTGARLLLHVAAAFDKPATLFHRDPRLGSVQDQTARQALMGDIVHLPEGDARLAVKVLASAPIERIDVFDGLGHLETIRPYTEQDLGNRIRVIWEGAAYRGRQRQMIWDGRAALGGNRIADARPINFFNPDRKLERLGDNGLAWRALTTGNFGGFDCWLSEPRAGELDLEAGPVKCRLALDEIGLEDRRFEAGGLDCRLRVFRLPGQSHVREAAFERSISVKSGRDSALYVRVTQEDGHVAWSSPIYLFR